MAASPVTVVVVSYNTREQLRRCLSCIEPEHEVVVVDNASSDGTCEMVEREFAHVRLIRNASNRGFGAANNQGMGAATRPLVLLLNSDAYAEPGAIARLASSFEDTRWGPVVACGGRLLSTDGSLQNSSANQLTLWAVFCEQTLLEKLFPHSRIFSPYWNSHRLTETSPVEQVMGACLMLRPVERFDERFFLYCEDTELCRRLRRRGVILYVPEARFTHELGASSTGDRWRSIARYNRGKELYFAIHHGPLAMASCWLMNRLGALLRLLTWSALAPVSRPARQRAAMFLRVLMAPITGPPRPGDQPPTAIS